MSSAIRPQSPFQQTIEVVENGAKVCAEAVTGALVSYATVAIFAEAVFRVMKKAHEQKGDCNLILALVVIAAAQIDWQKVVSYSYNAGAEQCRSMLGTRAVLLSPAAATAA